MAPKSAIAFLLFCFFGSALCSAQVMTLERSGSQKTFALGSVFEISTFECSEADSCGRLGNYEGIIHSITDTELNLKLISFLERTASDGSKIIIRGNSKKLVMERAVSIADIQYLRPYKSMKALKRRKAFGVIGGILVGTGATTAINALLVSGKNNSRTLLEAGLGQIGVGITFGILSQPKRYAFKDVDNPWRLKR